MYLKRKIKGFLLEMLFMAVTVYCGIFLQKEEAAVETSSTSFAGLSAPARQVSTPLAGEKICYLTFDDGPSSNTEAILDILKEYGAKATFFVIGNELTKENEATLKRIKEEGHSIGLHAYNHVYEQFYASPESVLADYEKLYIALKEDYGIETSLFRFPGGSACAYLKPYREFCLEELAKRGFTCFDWQISGEDAVGYPTVESIQKNVLGKVYEYDTPIVLLHDGRGMEKTAEALPGILKQLQEKGYRFSALEHAPEYTYTLKK